MPKAIWSGAISFGLVNIPVKLYSAISRKTVRFNQIDKDTNARVKQKRVSAETGEEVPWDNIVKGYELPGGSYVIISDDDLAALDPKAVRTIEIEEFVDLHEIDPIFFDAAYYLGPERSSKPYALLCQALEESGKVGIAHFVMRTKQYLAAIRPENGVLLLSTMVYPDEINDPAEIPGLDEVEDTDVSKKELDMARSLIESLSTDFVPETFKDTYREAVLEMIEAKSSGIEITTGEEAAEPTNVIDLMAALEKSVAAARDARGRHPASDETDGAGGADDEMVPAEQSAAKRLSTPPAKSTTSKSAARKSAAKKPATKKPAAKKSTRKKAAAKPAKKAAARKSA